MHSTPGWVKLSSHIPEDENIFMLECTPDGPAACWLWIRILLLAAGLRQNGKICVFSGVPIPEDTLAFMLRVRPDQLRQGLDTLEQFGLITREGEILRVSDWEEYAYDPADSKCREAARERQRRWRERQKKCQAEMSSIRPEMPDLLETDAADGISPEEAHRIREDQNDLLDLAEKTGLASTPWDYDQILKLYGEYGREKLEFAISEAAGQHKLNLKYVVAVCRNRDGRKPGSIASWRNESIPDWN